MARHRKMRVEPLEDRRMLAVTVNTLVDELDGSIVDGDVSLRDALAAAAAGETIDFSVTGTINLTLGGLVIDKNLTIDGPGADLLTIDASGNDPTPDVNNNDGSGIIEVEFFSGATVAISGLTLTGADGDSAIRSLIASLTLDSCKVIGNHGGGAVNGGAVAINNCEITGNSGISMLSGYNLEISGSTISNNMGRAVDLLYGNLEITDSTISGNTAGSGSAIFMGYVEGDLYFPGFYSTATITNTVISGNTATSGSVIHGIASDVTLIDCTVSGNLVAAGAAIGINAIPDEYNGGVLVLENTDVVDNQGEGIFLSAMSDFAPHELRIVDSNISGNEGTGLRFFGDRYTSAQILNSSFNNNARGMQLGGDSGPFEGSIPTVTIQGSEIKDNTTGGGLTLLGVTEVEIVETTISGNHNTGGGGGISAPYDVFNSVSLSIRNSTISGNSTDGSGGGLAFYGALTIKDSTISGNTAQGLGGGLWLHYGTGADVLRSTISGNAAGSAGGGVVLENAPYGSEYGSIHIRGSIIANNTASALPHDLLLQDSWTIQYSLIENPGSLVIGGPGNIVGMDPMLGPLADNGGPTLTHALLAGSPANDAGDPAFTSPPDFDQRGMGFARVFNGRIDMGAFERQPETSSLIVTTEFDVVDAMDGATSLREAVAYANSLAGADTVTFDAGVFGTARTINLVHGELAITDDLTITGTGAEMLTIDAGDGTDGVFNTGDGTRIFNIYDGNNDGQNNVTLDGMTLTGGDVAETDNLGLGGAVLSRETLILRVKNSVISGNAAARGGGIFVSKYNDAVIATITNTFISDNTATEGSAVYSLGAEIELFNSTISGNLGANAAVYILGNGPIFYHDSGSLRMHDTTVSNNEGHGVQAWAAGGLDVLNSTVSGNTGTGIRFAQYYDDSGFDGLSIINSSITGNERGLYLTYYGLADGDYAEALIDNCIISNNIGGGGIKEFLVELTITNSLISGNQYLGPFAGGGGIDSARPVSISNCTISGNAGDRGGGLFITSTLSLTNSTVTGNTASEHGGGMVADYLTIRNSIVAGNSAGFARPDLSFAEIDANYTLIGDTSGLGAGELAQINAGTGNLLNVDPLLGPLNDNGGPTLTHALVPGSPAIDAGDPAFTSPPDFDQRGVGFSRVVGGRIDMGAFEVQAPPASGDFDLDGDVDGRDFMLWQRGGSPSPLSGGDLVLWEDNYGENELSAISSQLLAREENEDLASYVPLAPPRPTLRVGARAGSPGATRKTHTAFEDAYAEEVDRALEQLATVPVGARSFGEMVARRTPARSLKNPFSREAERSGAETSGDERRRAETSGDERGRRARLAELPRVNPSKRLHCPKSHG